MRLQVINKKSSKSNGYFVIHQNMIDGISNSIFKLFSSDFSITDGYNFSDPVMILQYLKSKISAIMEESFLHYIEFSIREHWNHPALTDYKGLTHSYKDVARKIEKIRILFEESGIQKGDKIALCSRNSSNWGIAFLAILAHGAVAIPILNEFKPDNIHHIINHSEAKLIFVGNSVWETLNHKEMPDLDGILRMEDYSVIHSSNPLLAQTREHLNELFGKKFPDRFTSDHVHYPKDNLDDLAMINYTSGTTSASKGVMLSYRSIWSNLKFAIDQMGYNPGEKLVSILTMAHMYGLAFEFIYPFATGTQIFFLAKTPSPKVIGEVFAEIRPHLIVAVPLIIEKIIKKRVLPQLEKFHIKLFLKIPVLNTKIKNTIKKQLLDAFGGRFKLLAVGGAALNHEVEAFLSSVKFPYTVGYGMTECGPGISYDHWNTFRLGSCGKAVDRIELKTDSPEPQEIVGEIIVRGENVMNGYYKNPEATAAAIDSEGWLHTGDLGVIDRDGYLFIKGRSKNMILGASGQNIYPEEIEDRMNAMPYVVESLIIEQDGKLIALVFPDFEQAKKDKLSIEALHKLMGENRKIVNHILPAYSQIARLKIREEEFEKTPKKSIKRYLYQ